MVGNKLSLENNCHVIIQIIQLFTQICYSSSTSWYIKKTLYEQNGAHAKMSPMHERVPAVITRPAEIQ